METFHQVIRYEQGPIKDGRAELYLDLRPELLNLGGVVHGGVLATLLDVVCAQAGAYSPELKQRRPAVTLSLNLSYTGQCSGGRIRAVGTLKSKGSRIFNSTGEVYDEEGNLLAMAQGTFRFRSGPPVDLTDPVPQ